MGHSLKPPSNKGKPAPTAPKASQGAANAFKQLRKAWYDKLAKAGFKDSENLNGTLKMYEADHFKVRAKRHPGQTIDREYYYTQATHFLNVHKFSSARERKIWELHANGAYYREIAKQLKISKSWVGKVVEKIRSKLYEHHRVGQN